MRRLLVTVLSLWCVLLPLQANAGNAVGDGKHCPHMQDMKASPDASNNAHSSDRIKCCNDAVTAAKTGQLCKTGHDCSPTLSYMLSPTLVQLALTADVQQLPAIPARIHTGPPSAVWRPPTLS